MKKIKYLLSIIVLSSILLGCDENNLAPVIDESAKPIVSYSISSTSALEIDSPEIVISITMDRPILTTTTFSVNQVGGKAVLGEDYVVTGGIIQAFEKTGQLVVKIIKDLDPEEDNETLDFQVGASAVPDIYEVRGTADLSISIVDWKFCIWTLETSDTYGDGWNGGFISVTSEGVTTEYKEDDDVPDTFEIPITDGVDYSISYVSGGGGFCGSPGYECENYFKLTAPDGTVWEEGAMDYSGVPTEGVLSSGTNDCP